MVPLTGNGNQTVVVFSFGLREEDPMDCERACLRTQGSSDRLAADIP